ncbi:hypothetical protein CTAYLR_006133 [Chrysophaeum taylorii]|uniref:AMP-dependent synthetase/ligase domain-containing protein n=1 Tax=Chrysophaeum taylorii TaxID=2483200 RepID=A0AAD7XRP2_9STRA|nr:hypothetical protein CTAYLR_006133 [Chrysophaeum taylorii]
MGSCNSTLSLDAACGEAAEETYGVFEVGGEKSSHLSPALRWGANAVDGVPAPPPSFDEEGNGTVWAMVAACVRKHGPRPCVGWRALLKREMEGKFEKLTLGDYEWWTYDEFGKSIADLSSGLPVCKGDCVLIFAETQRDWFVTALACFRVGCTVVTAYATLGEEGVTTALGQTNAKVCVCDAKLLKILASAKSLPRTLKHVITIGDASSELKGFETETIRELVAKGAETPKDEVPVEPSDVALIMYTSGTTGTSKGVVITQNNLVAHTMSFKGAVSDLTRDDVHLAYLPLAHIMEFCIELWCLSAGGSMGYGSPHTLTDTGVKLQKGCRGDAPLLRPTCMLFAPAVLDKVYAAVMRKIDGSSTKEFLFGLALEAGKRRYAQGLAGAGPIWDALLMKKIQALVGGRLRYSASGSAPLSPEIQVFMQTCFNSIFRQGYGCTEGGTCIGRTADNTLGQVGPPSPATFVRLRDWEEGGYLNADISNPKIGRRRGEILLGGPTICAGYWVDKKRPDPEIVKKNADDFVTISGVRYFCTGDIGEFDERGRLRIVDRKKDLFKGATGEYVALIKVEAALKLSKYVELPVVYGKTGAKGVVALVCPQMHAIEELKRAVGLHDVPYGPELCKRPEIVSAVSDALKKQCKDYGLLPFETPLAYALVVAPDGSPALTPDNGLLTSTMKVKRPIVTKAFQADLDAAYATVTD